MLTVNGESYIWYLIRKRKSNDTVMALLSWKLISSGFLLALVFLCGGLPLLLIKCCRVTQNTSMDKQSATKAANAGRRKFLDLQQFLGALNSFAGGVFLATCMLDLLPEAREAIEDTDINLEFFQHYPLAELMVIFGVVFLLICELCIDRCTHKYFDSEDGYQVAECVDSCDAGTQKDGEVDDQAGDAVTAEETNPKSPLMKPIEPVPPEDDLKPLLSFRMVALVIALSFHSIFDGLAIGLQTSLKSLLEIFIAIAMHKSVFSFSLGIRLTETRKSSRDPVYLYLLVFASATPIGIVIGILITHLATSLQGGSIATGLLQSLATGTLMYVTFFEILPEELRQRGSVLRFLSMFLGVGIVAILTGVFVE